MSSGSRRRRVATRARQVVQGETLVHRLFLLRFLHKDFGFHTNVSHGFDVQGDTETRALLTAFKDTAEGYGNDGPSYVASGLVARADKIVSEDELRRYDANVRSHLYQINERR